MDLAAASQSDQQQLAMTKNLRHRLDGYLAVALRSNQVLSRQQAVRIAMDAPDLVPIFQKLQTVTGQLANTVFATPAPPQLESWKAKVQSLSQEKEDLERQLATKSAEYRTARAPVNLEDVAATLPDKYALVDFVEYGEQTLANDRKGVAMQRRLTAFVVRRDHPVRMVDLGWRAGSGALSIPGASDSENPTSRKR